MHMKEIRLNTELDSLALPASLRTSNATRQWNLQFRIFPSLQSSATCRWDRDISIEAVYLVVFILGVEVAFGCQVSGSCGSLNATPATYGIRGQAVSLIYELLQQL
jgi:hypothetical protein